jgi:hypothetical protein
MFLSILELACHELRIAHGLTLVAPSLHGWEAFLMPRVLSPPVPQVLGVTLGSPLCPWCFGHSSWRGARQGLPGPLIHLPLKARWGRFYFPLKGHFTHKPIAVPMKLWGPKRKCPNAIPRYPKMMWCGHKPSNVVWSHVLWPGPQPSAISMNFYSSVSSHMIK